MCVLVDEDEVEMRCQSTADDYAVKKIVFNIFGRGKFLEAQICCNVKVRWRHDSVRQRVVICFHN